MPRNSIISVRSSLLQDEQFKFLGQGDEEGVVDDGRTVGLLGVIVIGFFWVAGGIYGNEELIGSGPSGYILGGIVAGGLLFALPFALMCAELATTYPENGGVIVPVRHALGMTAGNHMAYQIWIVNALDASIYPLLAAQYIKSFLPDIITDNVPYYEKICVSYPIILLVTIFNLAGLNWVVRFSNVIFIFALTPCLIYLIYGFATGHCDFNAFTNFKGDMNMSLAVSWIIWLYSGFISLGILAGEVKNPQKTFFGAVLILVPLTITLNVSPIVVSLGVDSNPKDYTVGYFEVLAEQLVGIWLKYGFIIGSIAAYIGLYNSQIVSAQEAFAFLIENNSESLEKYLPSYLHCCCIGHNRRNNNNNKNNDNSDNDNNNDIMSHNTGTTATTGTNMKQNTVSAGPAAVISSAAGGSSLMSPNHLSPPVVHVDATRMSEKNNEYHRSPRKTMDSVVSRPSLISSNLRVSLTGFGRYDVAFGNETDEDLDEEGIHEIGRSKAARRTYVFVNLLLVCLFEWLGYAVIVQAEMLVDNIPLFLLCFSYIYLKFKDESRKRPFSVPGGIVGACICVLIPSIVLILYTYVILSTPDGRTKTIFLFFVIVGIGFFAHVMWILIVKFHGDSDSDYKTGSKRSASIGSHKPKKLKLPPKKRSVNGSQHELIETDSDEDDADDPNGLFGSFYFDGDKKTHSSLASANAANQTLSRYES